MISITTKQQLFKRTTKNNLIEFALYFEAHIEQLQNTINQCKCEIKEEIKLLNAVRKLLKKEKKS